MRISKTQYNILFLAFISFILWIVVFKLINYLNMNGYIKECFINDRGTPETSHTVNLPLTTKYSCKNFCGPTSRCAITGHQCTADIDCPGCQPYVPPLPSLNKSVPGNNDAGKLTWGVTPTYSELTTDIGTQAAFFEPDGNNKNEGPPKANFGVNVWRSSFDEQSQLFAKRYTPSGLQFMPNYHNQTTTTGEFINDGPLASNDYLH